MNVNVENKKVKLRIYDPQGHGGERVLNNDYIRPSMFSKASGVILVYDITDLTSFDKLHYYHKQIEENVKNKDDIVKFLVGNKCDEENKRRVTEKEGNNFAIEHNYTFYEISVKNNINVDDIFYSMTKKMIRNHEKKLKEEEKQRNNIKINKKKCSII